jgi:hypothetical protein
MSRIYCGESGGSAEIEEEIETRYILQFAKSNPPIYSL